MNGGKNTQILNCEFSRDQGYKKRTLKHIANKKKEKGRRNKNEAGTRLF